MLLSAAKNFFRRHGIVYPKLRFWITTGITVFIVWFIFSLPFPLFDSPYSTVLEDRRGEFLSARIASDYQWRFPETDTVPVKIATAIRLFEDEYFYYHPGINPVSIVRALIQNIRSDRVVSGGSTLSMQVIRLCKQHKRRNIFTKLYEMVLAVRLETEYSKDEILAFYASHAPFGGNVVGLDAAAWRYFGRPASRLSWGESTALAVLPNAPSLVFPGKNHREYLRKRNRLLDKLHAKKIIDSTTCELAKTEPLPGKPTALPQLAPHLLSKLMQEGSAEQTIRSTLDVQIQQKAIQIAQRYGRYYSGNYIHNAAIVVMNTTTGEVLAYVGNINLENQNNAPFVDNAISNRSSGSILKPFLYAAMLHEGELLPQSLVSDVPTHFGAYAPENFEKTYQGVVPADAALAQSLNIPAVRELDQYGVIRFHQLVKQTGFTTISKNAEHYGLSLILGGAEVNLLETTAIYAGMGRAVEHFLQKKPFGAADFKTCRYVNDQPVASTSTASSPLGAASLWYTLEALTLVNRPWAEIGWEAFASTRKIAWKTGTSIGSRDAWSVGVTPAYTVGVWVGNASGEGRPGLTGVTHAAPLMFEVFKTLPASGWYKAPLQNMRKIKVCKMSGFRAGAHCTESELQWVPENGVKAKSCPYHYQLFLDETGQYRVNADCYPVHRMIAQSWFILPPAQEYFYRHYHPEYRGLPPNLQNCSPHSEQVMEIISPDNNSAIFIPRGFEGETGMLVFEAVHRNKDATIYWHIDNEFVEQTRGRHKIEVSPAAGKHQLVIMDQQGNKVSRRFKVVSN